MVSSFQASMSSNLPRNPAVAAGPRWAPLRHLSTRPNPGGDDFNGFLLPWGTDGTGTAGISMGIQRIHPVNMGFYRDLMGFYSDLMGFYSDLMGFYSDLMGFYSDLMGFYSDLMGFYSDLMGY